MIQIFNQGQWQLRILLHVQIHAFKVINMIRKLEAPLALIGLEVNGQHICQILPIVLIISANLFPLQPISRHASFQHLNISQ